MAACALLGWPLPRGAIDWQPALAPAQPWRAFTAVGVHYSAQHLVINLLATAIAAAFGVVARTPIRMAVAWLAAWPLTQLGLLAKPGLVHYGGLSGVLHASVAIVVVFLLAAGLPRERLIAAAVGIGLIAKVVSESPWGEPLRHPAGWDIAVAPFAHLSGVLAGTLCAALALAWPRSRPLVTHDD